jgi:hypothetical protein
MLPADIIPRPKEAVVVENTSLSAGDALGTVSLKYTMLFVVPGVFGDLPPCAVVDVGWTT